MAFKRLSDDEDVDSGVPLDIDDDEELDGEDDEAEEGLEKDGVIGPEDPYKEDEEKVKTDEQ
jgi:hypothetical protein